ncbi:hydrogenase/urease nickel incorporation protein HypA [Shewanella sp. C32]|uniref:Hydrogenase maturation factor HypA n=1 Tax=Shewanella electrica TaxID=515560 RepID=A0ABT2FKU3_9GAMM|nr:hydrogenase/urease nickel incorporation protein HypA [Shewanella electrica]MCH1923744.1 hydrogenase/urease nickel incorporation protein HypA [Shewanella electrica]MCS4556962.1 hydrogenase/urease nickel incorporation protein HypA [Shewanella electrica]
MHEFSIVSALINQCEELAAENKATGIARVAVKIGALSGVEPQLVKTAFDTFREDGICRGAELEMEIAPLELDCRACGAHSIPDEIAYLCPACQSRDIKVSGGEEMLLMQLELMYD